MCDLCQKIFSRRQTLLSHRRTWHEKVYYLKFLCEICGATFDKKQSFDDHIQNDHEKHLSYKLVDHAFAKKCVRYRKYFSKKNTSPNILLSNREIAEIAQCLFMFMQSHPWVKYNIVLSLSFGQFSVDGKLIGHDEFFSPSESESLKLNDKHSIVLSVRNHCVQVTNRFEDILFRGSGFKFIGVKYCDISIVSIDPSTSYKNPKNATIKHS